MTYQHQWTDGKTISLPVGKVVCVGRNYAAHAQELNHPIPSEPLLFMKPETAIVPIADPIAIPVSRGAVHHEAEIAVLIGTKLSHAPRNQIRDSIIGIGAALDLTLRDLQQSLKDKGYPWEKAKSFDGSCPLSCFEPAASFSSLLDIEIELRVGGLVKQTGSSAQMIYDIQSLIEYISTHFTLNPGDVVLTGTPEGVGPLHPGDEIQIRLHRSLTINTTVTEKPL